jgi:hypothetical protein
MEKPEITLKSISGGMKETMETGKYPEYYTLWSRKYKRSWCFEELPVEFKVKGEVVHSVNEDLVVYDENGRLVVSLEFISEMRD